MNCKRCGGLKTWLVFSGVMLLVYLFSIGWRTDYVICSTFQRYSVVQSNQGRIGFTTGDFTIGSLFVYPTRPGLHIRPSNQAFTIIVLPRVVWPAGFLELSIPVWMIGLPIWFITFIQGRHSRRVALHQCAKCGYDLRGLGADKNKCPECGGAIVINRPEPSP